MNKAQALLSRTLQTKQPEKLLKSKSGSCSLSGVFLGQIDPKTKTAPNSSEADKKQAPKKAVVRVTGITTLIENWLESTKEDLPYEPDLTNEFQPAIRFTISSDKKSKATNEVIIEPQLLPAYDDRYRVAEGDILYLSSYSLPLCTVGQPVTAVGVHYSPVKSNVQEGQYVFFLSCVGLTVTHEHETYTWPYEWKFRALFHDPYANEQRWILPEKSRTKNNEEDDGNFDYQKAQSGVVYLDGGLDPRQYNNGNVHIAQRTHYKAHNPETTSLEDGPGGFCWKDRKTMTTKCFMPSQAMVAYYTDDSVDGKVFTDEIKVSLFDELVLGTGITNVDDWKSTWKEPIPCHVLLKVDNQRTSGIATNYYSKNPQSRIFETKTLACCWLVYKEIKRRCIPVTPKWVAAAYANRRKNSYFKTPTPPSKKMIHYLNTEQYGLIKNISETIPEDQSFDLESVLETECNATSEERQWFFACKVDVSSLSANDLHLLRTNVTNEKDGDAVMNMERIDIGKEKVFINLGNGVRGIIFAYKKKECEEMDSKLASYLEKEEQKWKEWPKIFGRAKSFLDEKMKKDAGQFQNTIDNMPDMYESYDPEQAFSLSEQALSSEQTTPEKPPEKPAPETKEPKKQTKRPRSDTEAIQKTKKQRT